MVTFLPRRRGPAATSIPYREQISITLYMPLTVIAYPERQLLRTLLAVLAHTECELGHSPLFTASRQSQTTLW
jgi:hypothetical protein